MPESSSNPYAPPVVQETLDVSPGLWKCEGTDLWVRNGAYLPEVDLRTGEIHPPDPMLRRITLIRWNFRSLLVGLLVVGAMFGRGEVEARTGVHVPTIAFMVGLWLVVMVAGRWTKAPTWSIRYPEARRAARRKTKFNVIWVIGMVAACAASVAAIPYLVSTLHGFRGNYWVPIATVLAAPLLVAILGAAFAVTRGGKLSAGEYSGDWLRLRGVHPAAIDFLRAVPKPAAVPANPDARTYVIHLAKFPLFDWFHVLRWRPLPCVNIVLTKLLNPKALDSRTILFLKPVIAGPEAVSEGFRERVQATGTALVAEGWEPVSWTAYAIPDRFNSRAESVLFLHRDRKDSLFLSSVRADAYPEQFHFILHSWLPEGIALRTSDERTFSVIGPACEWDCVPGLASGELISRHMGKSGSRNAVVLVDARDVLERVNRLSLDNHAWLQAKKMCGPLEENFP